MIPTCSPGRALREIDYHIVFCDFENHFLSLQNNAKVFGVFSNIFYIDIT